MTSSTRPCSSAVRDISSSSPFPHGCTPRHVTSCRWAAAGAACWGEAAAAGPAAPTGLFGVDREGWRDRVGVRGRPEEGLQPGQGLPYPSGRGGQVVWLAAGFMPASSCFALSIAREACAQLLCSSGSIESGSHTSSYTHSFQREAIPEYSLNAFSSRAPAVRQRGSFFTAFRSMSS